MSPHSALTANDIKLLFEAVDGDGTVRIAAHGGGTRLEAGGRPFDGGGPEAAQRLAACGYLEGGPDLFRVTRAGQEYAESMQ
jgi:hypothetical protein